MADLDYEPRIQVPDPCPDRPPGKVVTALIAWGSRYSSKDRPETEASRRWLASGLVRTDDKAASGLLRRLCKPDRNGNQWLVLKTKSVGLQAHRYGLGPAASSNRGEWQALGEQLFGRKGYLSEFMNRGIIRHRELNVTGCLVLGYLMVNGPSTKGELFASLDDFMRRPTISSSLSKAIEAGLVESSSNEYSLIPSFWDAVDAYETERGLKEVVAAKNAKHEIDRAIHREEVRTHNYLQEFKNGLRNLPCTYCGKVPDKRGGGTVEHYPPIHWGGSDKYSLLFPACAKCNGDDSPKIKRTPRLNTPFPGEVPMQVPGDLAEFLLQLMYLEHDLYAIEMASGRPEIARERVIERFPIWVAYRNEMALQVDETSGDNSLVGFTRLDLNDPGYLDHIRKVRITVEAHRS
jgi:hypothetical protein